MAVVVGLKTGMMAALLSLLLLNQYLSHNQKHKDALLNTFTATVSIQH